LLTKELASSTTNTVSPPTKSPSRLIRYVQDGKEYPSLFAEVYIEGPKSDQIGFSSWLGRAGVSVVDTPNLADFVIFTGGSDVSPHLYGQKRLPGTYVDGARDIVCQDLHRHCREHRIPMLGICRGAQFLWVMEGGSLWQDINNHEDGEHTVMYLPNQRRVKASSVHHQSCQIGNMPNLRILMTSTASTQREDDKGLRLGPSTDVEAYYLRGSGILGIQGHPEYSGYEAYSHLCIQMIRENLLDNAPLSGGYHRVPKI